MVHDRFLREQPEGDVCNTHAAFGFEVYLDEPNVSTKLAIIGRLCVLAKVARARSVTGVTAISTSGNSSSVVRAVAVSVVAVKCPP